MALSTDEKKLSQQEQKQFAGGKPRTSEFTIWDNPSTWMCCHGTIDCPPDF